MYDPRKAHTQYDDYKGEAAFDIADSKLLTDLAQRLDISRDYWPVGFDFSFDDTCLSKEYPEFKVSIYAVNSNEYGTGIDAINKSILSKNSSLQVKEFSKKMNVQDFSAFFKRFRVTGFNNVLHAEKVEVVQ